MVKRNHIIIGLAGVALAAFLLKPQANAIVKTDNDGGLIAVPYGPLEGGWLGGIAIDVPNKEWARTLLAEEDSRLGFWFMKDGRHRDDVMAIFDIESGFEPTAFNKDDGGVGNSAYGIGQVLASTASDRGFANPDNLLNMQTGIRATLYQLKWSWEYLEDKLGRKPSKLEWIGSYNAGVGAILKGRWPFAYLLKYATARFKLG